MPQAPLLTQTERIKVWFNGRKLLYFSGCDYYRMASHPEVLGAARDALSKYGLNVAASRVTTGNHPLYVELEESIAEFFGAPTATLVSSGYLTNLVVTQILSGEFTHALVDSRSHIALKSAAKALQCPVLEFRHRDAEDLARMARPFAGGGKLIVLTDGMFSHDGSTAPLKAYLKVLPESAILLVDDAHGGGIVGETGRGTLEEQGVPRRRIIQTITLSKAFGAHGGAILGPSSLRNRIFASSPIFSGNTPPPLPIAAAALASVQILRKDRSFRERLHRNARAVKTAVAPHLLENPGPIIPVIPQNNGKRQSIHRCLLRNGIYPPLVVYGHGPRQGYFRFVISSEHRESDLRQLITVLEKVTLK